MLLKEKLFPSDNILLNSCKKACDIMKYVGVVYNSYHACINNYILYKQEEYDTNTKYLKCKESRYSEKRKKKLQLSLFV